MSRLVTVQVRCDRCGEVYPLGHPDLDAWALEVPVRIGQIDNKGDYCPGCMVELEAFLPETPPASDLLVCDVCGSTFRSRSGLGAHRSRTHGIAGTPRPKAKTKRARRAA